MKGLIKGLFLNVLILAGSMIVFNVPPVAIMDSILLGWVMPPVVFTVINLAFGLPIMLVLVMIGGIVVGMLMGADNIDKKSAGCLGVILYVPISVVWDVFLLTKLHNTLVWFPQFGFWPAVAIAFVGAVLGLLVTDWSALSKKNKND